MSHLEDSIQTFQKAAQIFETLSPTDEEKFLAMKESRQTHATALKSHLKVIGEKEQPVGSAIAVDHGKLFSVKDLFTSSDSISSVYKETLRGEKKLLEYIDETFADLDAVENAVRKAIAELKGNAICNISELQKH